MNDTTHTRTSLWVQNPSLLWLPFALPFLFGVWGVALGALFFVLIVRKWEQLHHSWRSSLFLPLLVLLLSIGASYLWFPTLVPEWGLLAVALSAGWLWRIEHILSGERPIGIEEWLFSARLFGLGSLAYLLLTLLLPIHTTWLPALLIVVGVLLHYYRINGIVTKNRFSCPLSSPLVRMAIVKGDQIWLTKRPYTGCYVEGNESRCHAPSYRDHPLTSCVHQNETPEEALTRAFVAAGMHCEVSPRFLLKYQHAGCSNNKRTIYLFVLNIKSEEYPDILHQRGKFYTPEQIEEREQRGLFSPLFSDEYAYLKNTLLKANLLNT